MPDEKAAFDVFLSHNSKDKPAVRQIAEALKARKLNVWLDETELIPGRRWIAALQQALEETATVAVCIGENGLGPWERPEIEAALMESVDKGLPVIPVLLPNAPADVELPLFLRAFTWVDLRAGLTDSGVDRLEWGIRGKKTAQTPSASRLPPPRLHNLPFSSLGDLLKGRDEELRKLQDGAATAITQAETIYGLGGIGKTRLAVEHAWRSGHLYDAAFFVVAESPEALHSGLANLARPDLLHLPEYKAAAQEESVGAVLRWLREHERWLLILDNVDTKAAEQAVVKILPSLSVGRVLITSRIKDWPATIRRQSIDTLTLEEAQRFILERTANDRTPSNDDPDQARRLAEQLDGLPLALEQAGAYISRRQMSLSEYLEEWERERERVLNWYDDSVMQYPASVAVTWQKTFEQLSPSAAAILRLTAYLAPDPIPSKMFEDGTEIVRKTVELLCDEIGLKIEDRPIREAMIELTSYSMVTRRGDSFTVHRIVQDVMQFRVAEERRRLWIAQTLDIVWQFAPRDVTDVRTWPTWSFLSPHASYILEYSYRADIAHPTISLMNHLALFFKTKALYDEAEPLMRRALGIIETKEPVSIGLAVILNNLAKLLLATDRLAEAEPLLRRSLKIIEKLRGANHPSVAEILCNLAELLLATGRSMEAEAVIKRTLKIYKTSTGVQHPGLAGSYAVLAQLLIQTHRPIEAEPFLRRSLEIAEGNYPHDHPEVALRLFNLGAFLMDMNRLGEADPFIRKALNILEENFGPSHPNTRIARRRFGRLQWEIAFNRNDPHAGPPNKANF